MGKLIRWMGWVVLAIAIVAIALYLRRPAGPTSSFSGRVPAGAQQVLLVEADSWGANLAQVTLYDISGTTKSGARTWKKVAGSWYARTGQSGFVLPKDRSEGSGTTPVGTFAISAAFGNDPAPAGTSLPYHQTQPGDCWISDPNDPAYNRWVVRKPCNPPNEDLAAKSGVDQLYHHAIVFDFNAVLRVPGIGSALFVHDSKLDSAQKPTATSGGIGLPDDVLSTIIAALKPEKNPVLVVGPSEWVNRPATG